MKNFWFILGLLFGLASVLLIQYVSDVVWLLLLAAECSCFIIMVMTED